MAGIQTSFRKGGSKNLPVYYKRVVDTDTGECYTIEAKVFLDKQVINDQLVYFIFDNNQDLFKEAYYYLNHSCANKAENTRYQKACALRLLQVFLILEPALDLYSLNLEALKKFCFFLKEVTGDKNTVRDNKTVNSILSNIAPMFDGSTIASLTWHAINEKKTDLVASITEGETTMRFYKERNKNYLREGNAKNKYVPEYIRIDEYIALIKIAQEHNDIQGEIIMRLMFCSGLRIGECLGLTIEDIKQDANSDKVEYKVLVRNRTTDSKRQCAKTKPKVVDKREYNTKTYDLNTDYIAIDELLYYQIMGYIETAHQQAMGKKNSAYHKSIADSVAPSDFENHYVFINDKGGNLLPKEWDERLRGYFIEAGLHVDKQKKEFGLNHRFRHGFAMIIRELWQGEKGDKFLLELKRLMRHKRLSSTMVYLRDTKESEVQLKMEFIEDLYNQYPELRYGFR